MSQGHELVKKAKMASDIVRRKLRNARKALRAKGKNVSSTHFVLRREPYEASGSESGGTEAAGN